MMAAIREWLIGVISIALICAAADSLMPSGSVRQVGKLVCGLAMTCALLQPLAKINGADISRWIQENSEAEQWKINLEQQSSDVQKRVIEEHFAAYISDKAEELGVVCKVEVDCIYHTDGVYLPQNVRIWGAFSDAQQSTLTELIDRELGVPVLEQTYYRAKEDSS